MQPTQELIDDIYRERVLRARRRPPEQKMMDALELFDLGCAIMMDGIRNQNPGASEEEVQKLLKARIDLLERLEYAR